jgi:hypothetical protein
MSAALQEDGHPSLADDVRRVYRLEAERDDLDIEIKALRRRIASQLPPGGKWVNANGIGFARPAAPTYRFNPKRAAIVLAGTDWFEGVVKLTPDHKLCEERLPDKLYRACCTEIVTELRRVP